MSYTIKHYPMLCMLYLVTISSYAYQGGGPPPPPPGGGNTGIDAPVPIDANIFILLFLGAFLGVYSIYKFKKSI